MQRLFLTCLILAVTMGGIYGQRLPDPDLPPPPITGLSDEQGVFGKNSGAQRRIVGLLNALERDHGYRIYVVLERSLITSTPSELASRYQQEWLPEGGGLVFVFEFDTRLMGFGRDLRPDEGMVADTPGVPAFGLVEIITKSLEDAVPEEKTQMETEVYLENIITNLVSNLTDYFRKKEAPVSGGRSLRLALVTIGALSLLALSGLGLGWVMGKADKAQSETRIFPMVNIPERLGAPYGGGGGTTGFFGIPTRK